MILFFKFLINSKNIAITVKDLDEEYFTHKLTVCTPNDTDLRTKYNLFFSNGIVVYYSA